MLPFIKGHAVYSELAPESQNRELQTDFTAEFRNPCRSTKPTTAN